MLTLACRQPQFAGVRQTSATAAYNPLVARLTGLCVLTNDECAILEEVMRCAHEAVAGQMLYLEGQLSDSVCVLIDGMACRYQMLPSGRRQIIGYILPGDLCDLDFMLVGRPDHSICVMTHSKVVRIATPKLLGIIERHPSIDRALRLAASIDHAILRQWLLNIGQRHGVERLSHFLCEYILRMSLLGQTNEDGPVPFWFNQVALADTLGMSLAHVNRSLQKLRCAGLIRLAKRTLTILNGQGLADLAGFDPQYLGGTGRPAPAI